MSSAGALKSASQKARKSKTNIRNFIPDLLLVCNCNDCWPEQKLQKYSTIKTHRRRKGAHPDSLGHAANTAATPVPSGSNQPTPPVDRVDSTRMMLVC
ncbi:unnamed protein product [Rhizoctonia solani]|uniref:Uncharacterized protein n=1 Tax=Rhizoctonia solani TaxID=456999 RepID=A0A8H3E610_9AGAM|nr:unnamed protein product [Rhizoctonia solani]